MPKKLAITDKDIQKIQPIVNDFNLLKQKQEYSNEELKTWVRCLYVLSKYKQSGQNSLEDKFEIPFYTSSYHLGKNAIEESKKQYPSFWEQIENEEKEKNEEKEEEIEEETEEEFIDKIEKGMEEKFQEITISEYKKLTAEKHKKIVDLGIFVYEEIIPLIKQLYPNLDEDKIQSLTKQLILDDFNKIIVPNFDMVNKLECSVSDYISALKHLAMEVYPIRVKISRFLLSELIKTKQEILDYYRDLREELITVKRFEYINNFYMEVLMCRVLGYPLSQKVVEKYLEDLNNAPLVYEEELKLKEKELEELKSGII